MPPYTRIRGPLLGPRPARPRRSPSARRACARVPGCGAPPRARDCHGARALRRQWRPAAARLSAAGPLSMCGRVWARPLCLSREHSPGKKQPLRRALRPSRLLLIDGVPVCRNRPARRQYPDPRAFDLKKSASGLVNQSDIREQDLDEAI
jgi:hypothetical protein